MTDCESKSNWDNDKSVKEFQKRVNYGIQTLFEKLADGSNLFPVVILQRVYQMEYFDLRKHPALYFLLLSKDHEMFRICLFEFLLPNYLQKIRLFFLAANYYLPAIGVPTTMSNTFVYFDSKN